MKKNNLFLDLHVIQTLPPSNINRDDTGTPKTALYGGVRRARVSSQSWKRAIREYFYSNSDEFNIGVRTLNLVEYVSNKIIDLDESISKEDSVDMASEVLKNAGIKLKNNKAKALFFISDTEAKQLAEAAINDVKDKKTLKDLLKNNISADIALFGRMVADEAFLNEDASSQVAHSISTHAIQNEFDFFTAVDDLLGEEDSGAGMLGTIEFNSSTIYRYCNVSIHELFNQLDRDKEYVLKVIKLYIESFVKSLPTGKVNTFANQTLPQAIVLTLRKDRPVNLVSAFEEPVESKGGYNKKSIQKLFKEYKKIQKIVKEPLLTIYINLEDIEDLPSIGSSVETFSELSEIAINSIGENLKLENIKEE